MILSVLCGPERSGREIKTFISQNSRDSQRKPHFSPLTQARVPHGPGEMPGMKDHAGPEEYLVGAVTFFPADSLSHRSGFFRKPQILEGLVPEIAQWREGFTEADIAVGVNHPA